MHDIWIYCVNLGVLILKGDYLNVIIIAPDRDLLFTDLIIVMDITVFGIIFGLMT